MIRRPHRILLTSMFALLVALVFVSPAAAAAPWFIMVYGASLPRPVILKDWQENLEFMLASTEEAKVTVTELRGRPYLELAFFWGPEWAQYVKEGKPVDALRQEQANQHARLYLPIGSKRPILAFDNIPGPGSLTRWVEPKAFDILARHGIPVQSGRGSLSAAVSPETSSLQPSSQNTDRANVGQPQPLPWSIRLGVLVLVVLGGAYMVRQSAQRHLQSGRPESSFVTNGTKSPARAHSTSTSGADHRPG